MWKKAEEKMEILSVLWMSKQIDLKEE